MPAVAAGSNSSSTSIVRPRRIVSTLEEERYFESEDEDEEGPLKQQLSQQLDSSTQVPSSSATLESVNVYEVIPEDYKKHHQDAEPQMHYLKQVDEEESLSTLITAALQDIRLHQARIKASLLNDTTWLQTYSFAYDDAYQERVARREARLAYLNKLQRDATLILRELEDDKKVLLTQGERVQVKLARWQRALELFVYSPRQMNLDLLGLLEKLLEGTSEEEELSQILSQASHMCQTLVETTHASMRDATEDAAEAEDAYQIRLEAHAMFARAAFSSCEEIQSQFRTNGRAALQIGHQLEFAEAKRGHCEAASILIRRWWMMENLAEQEENQGPLRVQEEVRGLIPVASCRMDPLFTLPSQSLEASKALKQLRAVIKSRGNAATAAATASEGYGADPNNKRRFDLTANLIHRTSLALEQRLLNAFSEIYSRGGIYDFSDNPRGGSIDWIQLRELAHALLLFDSGRNLHKRYVEMVISSRFPELFQPKKNIIDEEDGDAMEFDMDATRSELSSLFHRVSDVCTAEFELIAHVFGSAAKNTTGSNEEMTLTVARALLQRVISDQKNGLQARISELLESIDRRGDFEAGAKKLDTFVVIHEKAAGLFMLLKDSAEKMLTHDEQKNEEGPAETTVSAVTALKQFLASQETALSSGHRKSYLNLELRLLHNDCCTTLDNIGCVLDRPATRYIDLSRAEQGILDDYVAPVLAINKKYLLSPQCDLLSGPLKSSVLRQPLICATDSLARARLMFGAGKKGGQTTARVISSLYSQMCNFYGQAYLYPIIEALGERLSPQAPSSPPQLPFDENDQAPDMGVSTFFWVALEYIHTAAKSFDRELWAENRPGSARVWETLTETGDHVSLAQARKNRFHFFAELEARGEVTIGRALRTLSEHIRWILVAGGESMFATGGNRFFSTQGNGPYAIAPGSSLEAPNSPAVKSLTFCLRSQFVNIQAALTPQSLSAFWTALSMRLYDIFVPRLLQHYNVTTVGAVILSRDVEALRSVSMLAGSNHQHWDNLRELVTLYMTPPIALKGMLVGPEGDINSGKGLFKRVGRYQSLVFLSRRGDYRVKTAQGPRKSTWVVELLEELGVQDPTEGHMNIGLFAAERKQ